MDFKYRGYCSLINLKLYIVGSRYWTMNPIYAMCILAGLTSSQLDEIWKMPSRQKVIILTWDITIA